HDYPLIGSEVGALPTRTLQGSEGAHERSNPRTIEFGNACEIHRHVRGTRFYELLNLIAERFFGLAEFQWTVQIKNGGPAGFTDANVHMCLTALCKAI